MSTTLFDESLWPLLVIHFSGIPTSEEFEAYLSRRLDYLRRYERHAIVYDTRRVRLLPAEMRTRHVVWTREHEALRREMLVANAIVITSPVIRLTLNLALHAMRDDVPYFVAPTLSEAALWAADRLRDVGHPIPAERIRRHFETSS
ncbi:hypothetical protein [Archangium sp.]|uniref:hypothetical protein n=1 Tax=Archangium sp. TaxID=1872627 RepID=UPI002D37C186|nr:hypothetical protein [Archangium sp.]HYO53677.1 hypothetical protein [Archangium sp.]